MRALLICNQNDADAGFIGERFRSHGYAFAECHREHPAEWPALDGHDLVLMLGSDWSVYWDHVAAEVAAEVALLRAAAAQDRPIFGICFGAQMSAEAFGGKVERAPEPEAEVGWFEVRSSVPEIAAGPWFEWHYDRVSVVPPGAEVLADNDRAVQAYRLGRLFATQFHPELTVSILERWIGMGGDAELARLGIDRGELLAATPSATAASRVNAQRIVDWFCESVVGDR